MLTTDFDQLQLPRGPRPRYAGRLWREWCFLRAAVRHFRGRFLLFVGILLVGALLFWWLDPEHNPTLPKALFCTWALVFGEPTEAFPRAPVLQVLFFVVPVLGLLVLVEALIDFSLMLRDRRRNERGWCTIMAAALSNHVILIGLGKLGYRCFRLLRRLGQRVVVIERNAGNQFLDDVRRDGAPLLIGDARREALLAEANAGRAASIILATNDDLANLEIALDARRINPHIRVVLRMFDQNMADKIRAGFNLQIAMSQSAISAPAFVLAALEESVVGGLVVDDQLLMLEPWHVRAGGPLCGRTVGAVMTERGVGVVRRRSAAGETQLMPRPETVLLEGDELLVQGMYDVLSALRSRDA